MLLKIQSDRTLKLALDSADDREDIQEMLEEHGTNHVMHELMEDWVGNGWGFFFADELGNLSNAPMIAEDSTIDNDGNIVLCGKVWYWPNYMVECEIETLLKNGEVVFALWSDFPEPTTYKNYL